MLRWVETGGDWPKIGSTHPAYFYTLRAKPGADRDLVNMLLAELAPKDLRQLFICHKDLFYRSYAGWSETKRGWVADFLEREYKIDKAGARLALFGPEPGMEDTSWEPAQAVIGPWGSVYSESQLRYGRIDAVGPWGAVQKGRI